MGTTHSLEELESLGAYRSHKRPRTLSRGSSAEEISKMAGKPRAASDSSSNKKGRSSKIPKTEDRSSPGSSAVKEEEMTKQQEEEPTGATHEVASAALTHAEDVQPIEQTSKGPVAAAVAKSISAAQYRSRQRPRHPDTKPPPAEELRRLMDKSRAMKEELESGAAAEQVIVEVPHENDVLLGRGRRCTEHHGNKLFRELVREKRDDYNKSWKYQKQELSSEIVGRIHALDPPGRFLELQNDGRWKEVTKKQALEKASQAMREKKWNAERSKRNAKATNEIGADSSSPSVDPQQKSSTSPLMAKKSPSESEGVELGNDKVPAVGNTNLAPMALETETSKGVNEATEPMEATNDSQGTENPALESQGADIPMCNTQKAEIPT